jgi:hypothetical protein
MRGAGMYDDNDIDRAARRMVHQLGDHAATRASDMVREQGGTDTVTGAMWSKILARIEELQWKDCRAH